MSIDEIAAILKLNMFLFKFTTVQHANLIRDIRSSPMGMQFLNVFSAKLVAELKKNKRTHFAAVQEVYNG